MIHSDSNSNSYKLDWYKYCTVNIKSLNFKDFIIILKIMMIHNREIDLLNILYSEHEIIS